MITTKSIFIKDTPSLERELATLSLQSLQTNFICQERSLAWKNKITRKSIIAQIGLTITHEVPCLYIFKIDPPWCNSSQFCKLSLLSLLSWNYRLLSCIVSLLYPISCACIRPYISIIITRSSFIDTASYITVYASYFGRYIQAHSFS